jgi:hypothetical protein
MISKLLFRVGPLLPLHRFGCGAQGAIHRARLHKALSRQCLPSVLKSCEVTVRALLSMCINAFRERSMGDGAWRCFEVCLESPGHRYRISVLTAPYNGACRCAMPRLHVHISGSDEHISCKLADLRFAMLSWGGLSALAHDTLALTYVSRQRHPSTCSAEL